MTKRLNGNLIFFCILYVSVTHKGSNSEFSHIISTKNSASGLFIFIPGNRGILNDSYLFFFRDG